MLIALQLYNLLSQFKNSDVAIHEAAYRRRSNNVTVCKTFDDQPLSDYLFECRPRVGPYAKQDTRFRQRGLRAPRLHCGYARLPTAIRMLTK
ncbi:hypothetical protein EVAR_43680_1 [Eumeta japonica]|uniref:Uncharacterized protein n=1 Tax=Eumeta variegata TaxID=151549 RepID=A0A4C1WYE3_EUMVA|nr:hypothetical protein EVAR_43680_1 [Eumeta japonica]